MLFLYWLDNIDTHNIKQHANNIGPIYACLLGYIPIPLHIRKGVLIRRIIIGSHLCKAVVSQQFCKQSRKLQTRIMFENYYSFFPLLSVVLSLHDASEKHSQQTEMGGTSNR